MEKATAEIILINSTIGKLSVGTGARKFYKNLLKYKPIILFKTFMQPVI